MRWRVAATYMRPAIGWLLVVVGLSGLILPIIPGIPLMVVGTAMVGRRDRSLRWFAVHWKLMLKRWSLQPHPLLKRTGRWAWVAQMQLSRQMRRLAWWQMERRRGKRGDRGL